MPIIVFANPKGGTGKTTSALILATEIAAAHSSVVLIDADPNMPISEWAELPNKPANIEVIRETNEQRILRTIDAAAERVPFVIIDNEGTASRLTTYAMSRADLVIIPMQGKQLDARNAAKTIELIETEQDAFRRSIPHKVLITRTSAAIRPKGLRALQQELHDRGVPLFRTELLERVPFEAIMAYGGGLDDLVPAEVSGLKAAKANAIAYMAEVLETLQLRQGATAQEVA
tara:strand:+ start:1844 stop:2536 length:693 start_codon:yes stop_codon:yes gene_type:complete